MVKLSRLVGRERATEQKKAASPASGDLVDGALDTLSSIFQSMGTESFQIDTDMDAGEFPATCREYSGHIENGGAVPSQGIEAASDGSRQWARVRRFYVERRQAERQFVVESMQDYSSIVNDLVGCVRDIGAREQSTESDVVEGLAGLQESVNTGALPEIKQTLAQTVSKVTEIFAEQKRAYETQLNELNDRMSSLRQDLVAAREEMKRDALTEAYNRGAFDSAILSSLNMHFVLQQPVTVLMIDLDNFKTINDSYGHNVGDVALRAVGESLARSFIRKNDLIARYGGDEFAVILTDTSAEQAGPLVERFMNYVREISVANGEVSLSCSVGYTEITDSDTVESLVARADSGLYEAKAQGRNRAVHVPKP